jgi:hypothetical protein
MRSRVLALVVLAATPRSAATQAPPPLDKAELIRLLTNPLFAQTEVADVVRRSCLTFHPTERDWADLRDAGAGGEVIASAASCDSRRGPVASSPSSAGTSGAEPPMTAVALPADVVTAPGAPGTVRVKLTRGRTPVRRATLALRGTTSLGLARDANAVTDDSGIAVFRLPGVGRSGTHQFEIRTAGGSTFPGQPVVQYAVRALRPSQLRVFPEYVAFGRGADSTAVVAATVTDSLGYPVSGEPVDLNAGSGPPLTAVTDSGGRASFLLSSSSTPRGGTVQLLARGLPPVTVEVAAAAGLSGVSTGFGAVGSPHSRVGTSLGEPVVFKARTVQGGAASGHTVRFRSLNAQVTPEVAVLDSSGQVRLDVVLGTKAGDAAVFATIDSVERILTLHADPGPIDALVLERNGKPVTGQTISVSVNTTFTLHLKAHDFYGNVTGVDALGQALRAGRARLTARNTGLQLVNLDSADSAVVVTLKAQHTGIFDFVIGSGITATARVNAVSAP